MDGTTGTPFPGGDLTLCGWRVRSELPLPDLRPWTGDDRPPDLRIRIGSVPDRLDEPVSSGRFMQVAADGLTRIAVDDIVAMLVADGQRVTIDPKLPLDAPEIALYVLGIGLAVICHQRGVLPLHASCVSVDGRAVAFSGESGAGKSTLAAALVARGCRLLADDVTVVTFPAEGPPLAWPAFPRQKLWRDSLDMLGLQSERVIRVESGMEKFAVPDTDRFQPTPLPLDRVYHLIKDPARVGIGPERCAGADAFTFAQAAVARPRTVVRLGRQAAVFALSARLVSSVPQYLLRRADGPAGLEAICAAILGGQR